MRKSRRKYSSPRKAWEKRRILSERKLMSEYGLKNKKELWKMEESVRNFRRQARELISGKNEERNKLLLNKLHKLGLLQKGASLEDVLKLTVNDILNRRFQTITFRKGFAKTINQSRQYIVHGHCKIDNRVVNVPSYLMMPGEEKGIELNGVIGEQFKPIKAVKEETVEVIEDVRH